MSHVLDKTLATVATTLWLLACQGAETSEAGSQPPSAAAGTGGKSAPSAGSLAGGAGAPAATGGKGGNASLAGTGGAKAAPAGAGGAPMQTVMGDVDVQRSMLAPDTAPQVADADYKAYITSINKLGLDLGQQVASGQFKTDNLVYSPLSATVALGMTYAGAKGRTESEMKTVLGDSFAPGVFHTATNKLARELKSREAMMNGANGDVLKLELNLADAIFVDDTVTVESTFLDVLSRNYDAGVSRLDFIHAFEPARMTINAWVEEQTKDKIQDLLPMGSITDATRLVLVNALYFYGSWATPFKREATQDAMFTTLAGSAVQVPTMGQQARFSYSKGDGFELAELPYLSQMSMTIVLPAQGKFEAVRSQVSEAWLSQELAKLTPSLVNVKLPKFKMTVGSFSLTDGLKALGMQQAFTDSADFTGIATGIPLSISDVVQKAFIEVDEKGTEAAAATGVIVGTTSVEVEQPIPFHVDRPFLFFIRDSSGAVLFSGHVVDPSK